MLEKILPKALEILPRFLTPGEGSAYRISQSALDEYNRSKGTRLNRATLKDIEGRMVAGWLLLRIATAYTAAGLRYQEIGAEDFIGLVALGYMAGWSENKGTLAVIRFLKDNGQAATMDTVWTAINNDGGPETISALKQKSRHDRARAFAKELIGSYMSQNKPAPAVSPSNRLSFSPIKKSRAFLWALIPVVPIIYWLRKGKKR